MKTKFKKLKNSIVIFTTLSSFSLIAINSFLENNNSNIDSLLTANAFNNSEYNQSVNVLSANGKYGKDKETQIVPIYSDLTSKSNKAFFMVTSPENIFSTGDIYYTFEASTAYYSDTPDFSYDSPTGMELDYRGYPVNGDGQIIDINSLVNDSEGREPSDPNYVETYQVLDSSFYPQVEISNYYYSTDNLNNPIDVEKLNTSDQKNFLIAVPEYRTDVNTSPGWYYYYDSNTGLFAIDDPTSDNPEDAFIVVPYFHVDDDGDPETDPTNDKNDDDDLNTPVHNDKDDDGESETPVDNDKDDDNNPDTPVDNDKDDDNDPTTPVENDDNNPDELDIDEDIDTDDVILLDPSGYDSRYNPVLDLSTGKYNIEDLSALYKKDVYLSSSFKYADENGNILECNDDDPNTGSDSDNICTVDERTKAKKQETPIPYTSRGVEVIEPKSSEIESSPKFYKTNIETYYNNNEYVSFFSIDIPYDDYPYYTNRIYFADKPFNNYVEAESGSSGDYWTYNKNELSTKNISSNSVNIYQSEYNFYTEINPTSIVLDWNINVNYKKNTISYKPELKGGETDYSISNFSSYYIPDDALEKLIDGEILYDDLLYLINSIGYYKPLPENEISFVNEEEFIYEKSEISFSKNNWTYAYGDNKNLNYYMKDPFSDGLLIFNPYVVNNFGESAQLISNNSLKNYVYYNGDYEYIYNYLNQQPHLSGEFPWWGYVIIISTSIVFFVIPVFIVKKTIKKNKRIYIV